MAERKHPKAPKGKHWDKDLHQFVRDSTQRPKTTESRGAKEFMERVREAKKPPVLGEGEQGTGVGIPAAVAPITPEKPATPTERLDAIEAKLAEMSKQISVIEGVINALKPNVFGKEEARP